jgi:hypothetical protein
LLTRRPGRYTAAEAGATRARKEIVFIVVVVVLVLYINIASSEGVRAASPEGKQAQRRPSASTIRPKRPLGPALRAILFEINMARKAKPNYYMKLVAFEATGSLHRGRGRCNESE